MHERNVAISLRVSITNHLKVVRIYLANPVYVAAVRLRRGPGRDPRARGLSPHSPHQAGVCLHNVPATNPGKRKVPYTRFHIQNSENC